MSVFNDMNKFVFQKNTKIENDIPTFLLMHYLSFDKSIIKKVNKMNKVMYSVPDNKVLSYFFHEIPKGNRYIKWIKKNEKYKKYEEQLKELVLNEKAKNLTEAKMLFDLFGKEILP